MEDEKHKPGTSNGTKAFGGVLAIVAVIAGVYAMVEPMSQRIDYISGETAEVDEKLGLHAVKHSHTGVLADVSAIKEKFTEVETQFRAASKYSELLQESIDRRLENLEKHSDYMRALDAAQLERIKTLEREVLGQAGSNDVGG